MTLMVLAAAAALDHHHGLMAIGRVKRRLGRVDVEGVVAGAEEDLDRIEVDEAYAAS